MDSAEDVLGAQKAGKSSCHPYGLTCSTETSNSSSFWGARRFLVGEESLRLLFAASGDLQTAEMLRFAQHDSAAGGATKQCSGRETNSGSC
jgi:hypothetical protein